MNGIRNINVSVSNVSAAHHVDPAELAGAIANSVNLRSRGNGISAQVQMQADKGSAALDVTIESESATPLLPQSSAGAERWSFKFKISATLTTADGQLIWQEKNADYSYSNLLPKEDEQAAWKDPHVRSRAPQFLGTWLVQRMFTGQ
jgi:hypothetical protein